MKAFRINDIKYREIVAGDLSFLREMLYEALYVPEGAPAYPKNVLEIPEIKRYIENWGLDADFGILALDGRTPIGTAWCRLFGVENKGFGFVDASTPEVTIAIERDYRNRGIGTKLLAELFGAARARGFSSLSLSVDRRNAAARLYRRMGFKVVNEKKKSLTMKVDLGIGGKRNGKVPRRRKKAAG